MPTITKRRFRPFLTAAIIWAMGLIATTAATANDKQVFMKSSGLM
jgi:hypothetical protein